MMKPTVYVETSIPSFYYEVRSELEMVVRKQWTQQWWAQANDKYVLVTSVAVLNELNQGNFPGKEQAIELIAALPRLPLEPAILQIGQTYIAHKLMPADPGGDALHLAIASYHKCDFLLTWNCRHLANANKFGHIRRINTLLGLFVPQLVTPLELTGESDGS
jgi:hypothetical protein